MDEKIDGWVDQAIKQDQFKARSDNPNAIPTQDQRHSVSIIDIFRSFNEIIEQIVQLNWDDDLQYAKFMTALSKSIGKGLARYCEILEQAFTKEMDRLTPEQEAALNQSRQEKWMQMAKEAWNSKEKIEPFQFFPEVNDNTIILCMWNPKTNSLFFGNIVFRQTKQHRARTSPARQTRARDKR